MELEGIEAVTAVEPKGYRLWLNHRRTVLVRIWDSGEAEIAFREDRRDVWGPPQELHEEDA